MGVIHSWNISKWACWEPIPLRNVILRFHECRYILFIYVSAFSYYTGFTYFCLLHCILKFALNKATKSAKFYKTGFPGTRSLVWIGAPLRSQFQILDWLGQFRDNCIIKSTSDQFFEAYKQFNSIDNIPKPMENMNKKPIYDITL